MPLFKTINATDTNGAFTKILVWKITESVAALSDNMSLTSNSLKRLSSMKSEVHKKGYLSVRKMLLECTLLDKDLVYDQTGKPFLTNGLHVSISHSHHFATIAMSANAIGIDIELQREKITKIAGKFCGAELGYLKFGNIHYIKQLTTIWAVKEAVYKIENQKGISFKDHILVSEFDDNDLTATLHFENKTTTYQMQSIEIENFILVYGTKIFI